MEEKSTAPPKRLKIGSEEEQLARVRKIIIAETNKCLAWTDRDVSVDEKDVVVYVDLKGILQASVVCLFCEPNKPVKLSTTKMTVQVDNFKRHLSLVHVTNKELKPGCIIKKSNQPPLPFKVIEKPASSVNPDEAAATTSEIVSHAISDTLQDEEDIDSTSNNKID